MKILVTGASGFLGRHVTNYLKEHGHECLTLDTQGGDFQGSVADRAFILNTVMQAEIDAIVHLAAIADIKRTQEDPYTCFDVNCFGTLNMLELAQRKQVKRLILASSANVYGAPEKNPVSENTPLRPRLPYDYSKVISENLARSYHQQKGLPVTITRSWLLLGEHDLPNRAIPRFIRACIANQPLTLYNAGRDTTAPSHARNYAKLVLKLLEQEVAVGEVFNFGGERAITIRELAETIKQLTHSNSELKMLPPRSEAEATPQVSYPDTSKIRKLLHYEYELDLNEGLQRTIEWIKTQPPN